MSQSRAGAGPTSSRGRSRDRHPTPGAISNQDYGYFSRENHQSMLAEEAQVAQLAHEAVKGPEGDMPGNAGAFPWLRGTAAGDVDGMQQLLQQHQQLQQLQLSRQQMQEQLWQQHRKQEQDERVLAAQAQLLQSHGVGPAPGTLAEELQLRQHLMPQAQQSGDVSAEMMQAARLQGAGGLYGGMEGMAGLDMEHLLQNQHQLALLLQQQQLQQEQEEEQEQMTPTRRDMGFGGVHEPSSGRRKAQGPGHHSQVAAHLQQHQGSAARSSSSAGSEPPQSSATDIIAARQLAADARGLAGWPTSLPPRSVPGAARGGATVLAGHRQHSQGGQEADLLTKACGVSRDGSQMSEPDQVASDSLLPPSRKRSWNELVGPSSMAARERGGKRGRGAGIEQFEGTQVSPRDGAPGSSRQVAAAELAAVGHARPGSPHQAALAALLQDHGSASLSSKLAADLSRYGSRSSQPTASDVASVLAGLEAGGMPLTSAGRPATTAGLSMPASQKLLSGAANLADFVNEEAASRKGHSGGGLSASLEQQWQQLVQKVAQDDLLNAGSGTADLLAGVPGLQGLAGTLDGGTLGTLGGMRGSLGSLSGSLAATSAALSGLGQTPGVPFPSRAGSEGARALALRIMDERAGSSSGQTLSQQLSLLKDGQGAPGSGVSGASGVPVAPEDDLVHRLRASAGLPASQAAMLLGSQSGLAGQASGLSSNLSGISGMMGLSASSMLDALTKQREVSGLSASRLADLGISTVHPGGEGKSAAEDEEEQRMEELNEMHRRLRRMKSNRESARRARLKRQSRLEELELQSAQLREANSRLLRRALDAERRVKKAEDRNSDLLKTIAELTGEGSTSSPKEEGQHVPDEENEHAGDDECALGDGTLTTGLDENLASLDAKGSPFVALGGEDVEDDANSSGSSASGSE